MISEKKNIQLYRFFIILFSLLTFQIFDFVNMIKIHDWLEKQKPFKTAATLRPVVVSPYGGDDHYVLVVDDKSWFDAQNFCRQHHTDLVSVRSPAENLELKRRLQEGIGVQEAWIGLHRVPWKWSDGSSSFFRKWLLRSLNLPPSGQVNILDNKKFKLMFVVWSRVDS
uniref:C-type lectin domain-containing protein n=1 Tax=Labrus bergylta TaxID=56723 RepID=A0A3Q3GUT3_9LABR